MHKIIIITIITAVVVVLQEDDDVTRDVLIMNLDNVWRTRLAITLISTRNFKLKLATMFKRKKKIFVLLLDEMMTYRVIYIFKLNYTNVINNAIHCSL